MASTSTDTLATEASTPETTEQRAKRLWRYVRPTGERWDTLSRYGESRAEE